jgi:putative aldouronate transport system substrate-binding protein
MSIRKIGFRTIVQFVAVSMLVGMVFTGCSSGTPTSTPTTSNTPTTAQTFDPLAKFADELTISTLKDTTTMKFPEGDSLQSNVWTRSYLQDLNIKVDYIETQDYQNKLTLLIASNQLPDIFSVNLSQLTQLVDAGKIEDLTQFYNEYALPDLKAMYADVPNSVPAVTFDGKMYALPVIYAPWDGSPCLWIRQDWLDKLSLKAPTTTAELYDLAKAFVNSDPDGNDKADTVGFGISNLLTSGMTTAGFFNCFHSYLGYWLKGSDETLVNGSIQPETKAALKMLQDMYKDKLLDQEFAVKADDKLGESIASGTTGMLIGPMWISLWQMQATVTNNPKADWKAYAIPSVDGQPAKAQAAGGFGDFYVVRKGFAHPEAAVILYNYYITKRYGEPSKYLYQDSVSVFPYSIIVTGKAIDNVGGYRQIQDAITNKDTSKLDPTSLDNYNQIMKYNAGDISFWGITRVFGVGGSLGIVDDYIKSNLLQYDEFFGAPTQTIIDKKASLDTMMNETFVKIIMGDSIDKFDDFVTQWKSLGGDTMTQEVNDWFKNR